MKYKLFKEDQLILDTDSLYIINLFYKDQQSKLESQFITETNTINIKTTSFNTLSVIATLNSIYQNNINPSKTHTIKEIKYKWLDQLSNELVYNTYLLLSE